MNRIKFALVLIAAGLSGCAGTLRVGSDVQSFSSFAAPGGAAVQVAPARYRFERLPSQQAAAPRPGAPADPQARAEAMVQPLLARHGWQLAAEGEAQAPARYSVQVGVQVQALRTAWGPAYARPWPAPYLYRPYRGGFVGGPYGWDDTPWYQREVSLVIRELASGRVVYETRATHDGRWSDNSLVLPAMFEAALQGFPNPPSGVRRVVIDTPPPSSPPPPAS